MKLLTPMRFIYTCLLMLFLSACGDSSDSSFPKPDCGSADNFCLKVIAFTISPANKTILVGQGQQYSATAFFDDGSQQDVTAQSIWSLDNTAVASISNDTADIGFAQGLTVGSTLISASYMTISASAQLNVMNEVVEQLIIVPNKAIFPVGTSQQYGAYLLLTNQQTIDVTEQVTWHIADSSIASIDELAQVLALSQGSTDLSASIAQTDDVTLTAVAQITVIASVINEIIISPAKGNFPVGTTGVYQASAHYTDGSVIDITTDASWHIADSHIGSINESGEFAGFAKALSIGSTQITASLAGETGATEVTVTNAIIRSISINPVAAVVPAGVSVTYQAHALYSDDSSYDITALAAWSSSMPDIANIQSVNALAGVASTFSAGVTQISAYFDGLTEAVPLTVTVAVAESLQITPITPSAPLGTEGQFTAIAYYTDGTSHDVTQKTSWQSTVDSVATIMPYGENGGFTISHAVGSSQVSAVFSELQVSTELTVTNAVLSSLSLTPSTASIAAGTTQAYQLYGLYSDGSSKDLTHYASWQSSDSSLALVSSLGIASALKSGQVTITATYQGNKTTASLTITQAILSSLQISPVNSQEPVGTKGNFTAIAYFSDSTSSDVSQLATWSSSDESIVSIITQGDMGGNASANSVGAGVITVSYFDVSDSTNTTVSPEVLVSLNLTPAMASIPAGTKQSYQLFGLFSDGSSKDLTTDASWQSSEPSMASIDSRGVATGHLASTVQITATYDDNQAVATLTVTDAIITSIQISPANVAVPLGTDDYFTAIAYFSNGDSNDITDQVTWQSDNSTVVSIVTSGDDGGFAQALSLGSASISATFSGILSNQTQVEVTAAVLESILISPVLSSVVNGVDVQYTGIAIYSDGSFKNVPADVVWTSSDTDVATIAKSGITTARASTHSAGVSNITANVGDIVSNTAILTVTMATITAIQISPADVSVPRGTQGNYTAIAYYSDASSVDITQQATWSSDASEIVSIVASGINGGHASTLLIGNANITATFDNISSNIAKVTVTQAVLDVINVSPAIETVVAGINVQYTAIGIYSDDSSVDLTNFANWQADTSIALMTSQGTALTYGAGSTEVTATVDGVIGRANLTVEAESSVQITSIQISPANVTVPLDTQDNYTATAYYSDLSSTDITQQATWFSDDISVVNVVASGVDGGLAQALTVGTANITASFTGITSNTAGVTVTDLTVVTLQISPFSPQTIVKGNYFQYQVIAHYDDYQTSKDVTGVASWSSDNTSNATIESFNENAGRAYGVSEGLATISASYLGVEALFPAGLTVTDPSLISIQISPVDIQVSLGSEDRFTATAYYDDDSTADITEQATWISDDNAVISIVASGSNAGFATALSIGSANISANFSSITSNNATVEVTTE
ncbi:MAG: Ig-like domain-containing protein [Colwellia sp.]